MYHRTLFLLACYALYRDVRGFCNEYIDISKAGFAELSKRVYVEIALSILFYVMVMASCIPALILF